MKLTPQLKSWLAQNYKVEASATDEEYQTATGNALAEGILSPTKYAELVQDERSAQANQIATKLDGVVNGLEKLTNLLTKEVETKEVKTETKETQSETKTETKEAVPSTTKKMGRLDNLFRGAQSSEDGDEKDINIRVKEAAENYSDTKSALIYPSQTKRGTPHPLASQPVMDYGQDGGHVVHNPSERDMAVVGAWGKFLCASAQKHSKNLAWMSMNQHDKELILYAMENMEWNGSSDAGDFSDINRKKLTPHQQKALIDDAVSGGIEAVPIPFDDMIVSTPLLYGELYPLVNTAPLDRGRRIQGSRAGTVTGSWGGVDDTAVALFNTASFVSAFDTTVYRWEGAIRIGLDFLSDTPIDFAQYLTTQYGEVLLQDLDDVIATGDGTTQPEGVMIKSGTTSVAWGGTTSIGNYESLRFGVHKRELSAAMNRTAVFCGTDTSYQRALAIPVGASDSRRLSQTTIMPNYDGYSWMGRPFKINESLTNAQIFFAVLGRYRMYRRRGLTIRTSTEGDTLIRNNEMLMVALARYGGQLERGACAAVTSTAPA